MSSSGHCTQLRNYTASYVARLRYRAPNSSTCNMLHRTGTECHELQCTLIRRNSFNVRPHRLTPSCETPPACLQPELAPFVGRDTDHAGPEQLQGHLTGERTAYPLSISDSGIGSQFAGLCRPAPRGCTPARPAISGQPGSLPLDIGKIDQASACREARKAASAQVRTARRSPAAASRPVPYLDFLMGAAGSHQRISGQKGAVVWNSPAYMLAGARVSFATH